MTQLIFDFTHLGESHKAKVIIPEQTSIRVGHGTTRSRWKIYKDSIRVAEAKTVINRKYDETVLKCKDDEYDLIASALDKLETVNNCIWELANWNT